MKLLTFTACLSILSLSTQAYECKVSSKYVELKKGVNKTTICNEAIKAITGSYHSDDLKLKIRLNGWRESHAVEVTSIKLYKAKRLQYKGSGVLYWNPDDSFITLK